MQFIATLARCAEVANLPFLLIGGNAVIAYGYPRSTVDIDFLVRESDRRAWDELLVGLGYRVHQIQRAFHMYNHADRTHPPVDLMLVDAATFTKLSTDSTSVAFAELSVQIPALPHLIALKLHAIRQAGEHRLERDWGDVASLIQINKVNLAAPPYPEIVGRYANAAARERLDRLTLGSEPPGAR